MIHNLHLRLTPLIFHFVSRRNKKEVEYLVIHVDILSYLYPNTWKVSWFCVVKLLPVHLLPTICYNLVRYQVYKYLHFYQSEDFQEHKDFIWPSFAARVLTDWIGYEAKWYHIVERNVKILSKSKHVIILVSDVRERAGLLGGNPLSATKYLTIEDA